MDGYCNFREYLSDNDPGNNLDLPYIIADIDIDDDSDGSDLAVFVFPWSLVGQTVYQAIRVSVIWIATAWLMRSICFYGLKISVEFIKILENGSLKIAGLQEDLAWI